MLWENAKHYHVSFCLHREGECGVWVEEEPIWLQSMKRTVSHSKLRKITSQAFPTTPSASTHTSDSPASTQTTSLIHLSSSLNCIASYSAARRNPVSSDVIAMGYTHRFSPCWRNGSAPDFYCKSRVRLTDSNHYCAGIWRLWVRVRTFNSRLRLRGQYADMNCST